MAKDYYYREKLYGEQFFYRQIAIADFLAEGHNEKEAADEFNLSIDSIKRALKVIALEKPELYLKAKAGIKERRKRKE